MRKMRKKVKKKRKKRKNRLEFRFALFASKQKLLNRRKAKKFKAKIIQTNAKNSEKK